MTRPPDPPGALAHAPVAVVALGVVRDLAGHGAALAGALGDATHA